MATNMYASSVDPSKTKANLFDQAKKRAFLASCVAHVLHDGYTDLIYVLLPIWQTQFGIGYARLAVIRALYLGSLAGLQLPANRLAERFGDFAGDLGKTALPGVTSLLLIVFSWHAALWVIAGLGVAVASLIAILLPNISRTSPSVRERFFSLFTDFSATYSVSIGRR